MSLNESDIVLTAVRAGVETLPKLKVATGIDYARLQRILYSLETTSVRKEESFEGFARYYPASASKPYHPDRNPVSVPLSYNTRTEATIMADEAALEQRSAPYCVSCRGVCFLDGAEGDRRRWKCRACETAFPGSLLEVKMAHIDPHTEGEARVREIIERGTAARITGPAQAIKHDVLEPDEERAIEAMREPEEATPAPDLCWCGREKEPGYETHRGMHRNDNMKAKKKVAKNGRGVHSAASVKMSALEGATGAKSMVDALVRDPFCLANCDPEPRRGGYVLGHHRDCRTWKASAPQPGSDAEKSPLGDTGEAAHHTVEVTEPPQPVDRIEINAQTGRATVSPSEYPMEIPQASIVSIDGFLRFNIEVQISVDEMSTWPSYKISDFWDGVRKVLAATKPDKPLR